MNARPSGISFLGAPLALEPTAAQADFAFLRIPYGDPCDMRNVRPASAEAPDAVRSASAEFAPSRDLQGHTACVINRLLMNAMGAAARRQAR